MKRVLWDEAERVGRWVCERVGGTFDPAGSTAIGIESDGRLVGGVLFDHYNGRSIAMHAAGEGGHWMSRDMLRACFGYAFGQLGVGKVIAPVDSENTHTRRFDEHLGFRLEATITGAGKTGDLCIYTMTPEQCRWLGARHGR